MGHQHQEVYLIYRGLGMLLRNKTPKRRMKAKLRDDGAEAVGPNAVWAMDFVHDQLATGKKLRVLTVVDTFSRYLPVLDARFGYRGEDVVATLDRTCRFTGYPRRSGSIKGVTSSPRHGPRGLPARGHIRLLKARQAD